ncbi:MAG: HAD hydrolase-like protein [Acetobacter indonesiensis]|nr:HAD hydrolase-like protein [Acetobacter indonesiensis]MCI1545847.1 HAD hydrolase-like protein [Acetobacter indonesiensis]MCI1765279.1 HAD hydrolase-like protein [Acetobacter indonesiensis]
MMKQKLAVFDMDGTLLDSLPDLADCGRQLLASYDLPTVSDAEVRRMIGNGVPLLVERLLQSASDKGAADKAETVDHALACRQFMDLYTPRATRFSRLFPGTVDALNTLRQKGWLLAVCTNKPEVAALAILEHYGLSTLFACVGGGDSFPVRKPDPAHLLGTIEKAGGTPSRSVMIGDMSPDLLAAQGAKCPAVFAAWGYGDGSLADLAQAEAASMADVPEKAESLLAAA